MMPIRTLLAGALLVAAGACVSAERRPDAPGAATLALTHVTVIDATGASARSPRSPQLHFTESSGTRDGCIG
jgi:hypothetical protein